MASSPECITWMVVGLTESVTIIALNSLTVIAFFRDRSLRKRSTYLVISLAVADMFTGGTSPLDLFYNVGETCNFWRHKREHWYQIPQVFLFWFLVCSFINMTVISLERLNATFWPFRHRTIKKSVYWVVIIAIWLTALLFSCTCTLIIGYYYPHKPGYYYYAWGSFISICLVVICVSYVSIFVKLRFGNQPRHHGAANRERKLTVTLFTVTSLSLLLWLPYVITTFLFFATNILSSLSEITLFRLELGSVILVYANCFLNPILYVMRMPGFRRALKMLCRQRPQPHREVEIIPLREINPQI